MKNKLLVLLVLAALALGVVGAVQRRQLQTLKRHLTEAQQVAQEEAQARAAQANRIQRLEQERAQFAQLRQNTADCSQTPPNAPASRTAERFDWPLVESGDYRRYMSNLRALGCPEKTIHDIIVAEVNEFYKQRAKAAVGPTNRFEYWKPGIAFQNMFNEEVMTKHRELIKEKRELLKKLLGASYKEKPDASALGMTDAYVERMLEFLPGDKQAAMIDLEQKYTAKLLKNLKDPQNVDLAALRTLLAEEDREALQVLSPEQKLEYDLRLSQTAMGLRVRMGDFEPTEQEFREIFRLHKQFDDEFGPAGYGGNADTTSKEERERRATAEKEMQSSLKSLLGEDRYREYKFEPDWQHSSLRDVARKYNVPKQTALKVFDIRDEVRSEASRVRSDKTLSAEQRQAALNGIRAATETALAEVLGANAARAYVDKGSWIKGLNK